MHPHKIQHLLEKVSARKITVGRALESLKSLPYEDLGFVKVDHHRGLRRGFPEVIFCQGKTSEHIVRIAKRLAEAGNNVLATRADAKVFRVFKKSFPRARYNSVARMIILDGQAKTPRTGRVCVVTAGSADIPVGEEAALTAQAMGTQVHRLYDVGVAGIHRLLGNMKELRASQVLIVVAGMEGALPSVVAGLVDKPVIAVPTSVGYGASLHGLAALLGMLNSCASGMTVVNIDNGFGAGYSAALICKLVAENKRSTLLRANNR